MSNKKLGELRPSQLITTFGPGSVIDGLNDSLTILDVDYWKPEGKIIKDTRLAQYMKVYDFKTPGQWKNGVPVTPFPDYHICSNKSCSHMFRLSKNMESQKETYHWKGPVCPKCQKPAYAARFIVYCVDGHMDDFPWMDWVHKGEAHDSCKGDKLKLYSIGRSSSMADIWVECGECNTKRSLAGALDVSKFKNFLCTGKNPHRPLENEKGCKAGHSWIPSQRGASNVYFSAIRSAISIPPWINPIDNLVDDHYGEYLSLKAFPAIGDKALDMMYDQYFKEKYTKEEYLEALERREADIPAYTNIKEMEYNAITKHTELSTEKTERVFKVSEENVPSYLSKFFSRVIRLDRLREVMVLYGFMRDSMPEPDIESPHNLVKLTKHRDNWLPAVENFGEGIFIEFNRETIDTYFNSSSELKALKENYEILYQKYVDSKGWENQPDRDGIYVLIHTFSHMLIKQLSDTCGYSSSALKERIYYGEKMNGILIYTGTSDAEGSLGGIVEMGKFKNLTTIIAQGLEEMLNCTSDPICSMVKPNLEDNRLSGASCHSCTMVPETSCEIGNRFLDRSLLVSLIGTDRKGFFSELVEELCQIKG